jgi:hypothetical protein
MKKTREERLDDFIANAQRRFGDKFDYSEVEFVEMNTNVTIICRMHGRFSTRPTTHINSRYGCSKCFNELKKASMLDPKDCRKRLPSGKVIRVGPSNLDLTGEEFGIIRIIEEAGNNRGTRRWKTLCLNCDHQGITTTSHLLKKSRKGSCLRCNGMPQGDGGLTRLYTHYKQDARTRRRVFTLTKEQFRELTSGCCHYCGIEPARKSTNITLKDYSAKESWNDYYYNGIDRLDSLAGYTIGNCVPCCRRCNYAKSDMPYDEFLEHIVLMVTHLRLMAQPVELHLFDAAG